MGFNVYMTEEEFQAVGECIGMMGTSLECGSEEYLETTSPMYELACNFENKCIKNRAIKNSKLGYLEKYKRNNADT